MDFYALEGIDGCGKSTQTRMLVDSLQKYFTDREIVVVNDPGTTPLGLELRKILLDRTDLDICAKAQTTLFLTARIQTWDKIVKPALDAGKIVIADRWHLSTVAYQAAFANDPEWSVLHILQLCRALLPIFPKFLVFDATPKTVMARMADKRKDRFESLGPDFLRKLRENYTGTLLREALPDLTVVDAQREPDVIHREVLHQVKTEILLRSGVL